MRWGKERKNLLVSFAQSHLVLPNWLFWLGLGGVSLQAKTRKSVSGLASSPTSQASTPRIKPKAESTHLRPTHSRRPQPRGAAATGLTVARASPRSVWPPGSRARRFRPRSAQAARRARRIRPPWPPSCWSPLNTLGNFGKPKKPTAVRRRRMSKAGGSAGAAAGPTAAAAAAAAQKQKTLLQKADADVSSLVDNFSALINIARVNDPPVRNSQEAFQMEMRAARMVHSADSLLKLVSELKRTAIFSGLASLTENVDRRIEVLGQQAEGTERMLERIGQEAAGSLKELEAHYYSSVVRTPPYD
ncbi:hypothetical protein ABZP36_016149 [Zizania latifolia]